MADTEKREIKLIFPDSLKGGVYCNNMIVQHNKEEFIMDFMMVAPPQGAVTARVIMNPAHVKRMITALQDNMKKYESRFGPLEPAEDKGHIGFGKN